MAAMGFRFRPSDEESISYLLRRVTGMLPDSDLIGTADLYGENEPWQIFGDSEEEQRYFFTTLKKVGNKKKNNDEYKRFTRNVGKGGTWSNKGQKIPILGKRGGLIGHKKCFRYVSSKKEDDQINGIWLLKEYTLPDKIASKNFKVKDEYKDCVLCVLKRKMKKKKTSRGDQDQSPRVESGLVNNNLCPEDPVQEIGNYYHHSYYGRGMDIYTPGLENPVLLNQENMSNYDDDHVNGDTPEMRAIAKSFLEEEKSYLQMKRSNYDQNNNIDSLGGCLPVSFADYLAAADCTPMEFLF